MEVDFTVLKVGDHVQFYEPHRTLGDPTAFHTAEILSIVDGDNPLVLSSRFMLSRHNKVKKIVPGVDVDDDVDEPSEMDPHWHFIESYILTCGGTHGHTTAFHRAADNAKKNARLMRRQIKSRIRKESRNNGLCLEDVFSHK